MLFIINNKKYDTENMTLVATVKKWYECTGWIETQMFGKGIGRNYDCKLYRSNKGSWLLTHSKGDGHIQAELISEAEAKKLLMRHDYSEYVSKFGELEEG